jgi:hypothetical protein
LNEIASPAPPGSPRAYWACQIVGWGGYALIQTYAAVLLGLDWVRALVELVAVSGAALFVLHRLRDYMRRHRWGTLPALRLAPRILAASLILGGPLGIVVSFLSVADLHNTSASELPQVGIVMPSASPAADVALNAANMSLLFAIWLVLYFIILTARRRRWAELRQSELVRALQVAELRLLKAQLNPHFLFNSLNSVRALVALDPARAQDAVTQLARTLRYTLSSGQDELVTLEQELGIVNDYLGLESLRLGDRLRIERDFSADALRAQIPVMLLQTLVENAIKHGVAELPEGGCLRLAAHVSGAALRLQVDNPRPARPAAAGEPGIGLRNAAERLRLLFGAGATLDLDLADGRATARVTIPVRP